MEAHVGCTNFYALCLIVCCVLVQDLVIATRVYKAKIMKKSVATSTLSSRACGKAKETIVRLLCAYSTLAHSLYCTVII